MCDAHELVSMPSASACGTRWELFFVPANGASKNATHTDHGDGSSPEAVDDPNEPVARRLDSLLRRSGDAQQQAGSRRSRRRIPER